MQKLIYFNQKPLIVLLLISALLSELNAFGHDTESSLGTFMIKSPESTDAPPGDEVQLQCELNLPPEKVEFRFRPQNSNPDERDRLINIHKMVRNQRSVSWSLKCRINIPFTQSGYNITTKDRLSKLHVFVNQKTIGDYRCVAWFGASAHASISAKLRLATISLDSKDTYKPLIHWKIAPKNSLIIRCGDVISAPDPVWSYYKWVVLEKQRLQVVITNNLNLGMTCCCPRWIKRKTKSAVTSWETSPTLTQESTVVRRPTQSRALKSKCSNDIPSPCLRRHEALQRKF